MSSESSAGPDGFNGKFFQVCWDIIEDDIYAFVNEFFLGKNLTKFYTHTCLALIPKIDSPNSFSDLRPISLSNFSNKIISKILANRLNPLLPALISENQSGLISGRLITDNVMLTQEIVHNISKNNKRGNVVLKLDMAKAYDRLHGFFTSSHGLKEGDPISPSLFVLVVEVLSRSLNNLLLNPNFIPFTMNRNGPQITHLAYADDIVIFSSGNTKSVKLVMKQIVKYERVSGQLVNPDKSCFLTCPKTCAYRINRLRKCTGFMDKEFPFTYLGCPIYIGKKKISYFDSMVTKVFKRLNGWQGNMLSCGGRQILIKSVIQALPTYILSAINPPKRTLELIEKHMCNFFWGTDNGKNKYHWCDWDKLCFPKDESGIVIRNMMDISNTLAVKRWWRFRSMNSLWADFLKAKYCIRKHHIAKKWVPGDSQAWKHLLWARDKSEKCINWKINSGDCNFWWDDWTGMGPLAQICPDFMIGNGQRIKVRDFMNNNRWNVQKLYNTIPDHIALFIRSVGIGDVNDRDYAVWKATDNGQYSNKFAWTIIRSLRQKAPLITRIWHNAVPFKISFLSWRLLHNKLPFKDAVAKFGKQGFKDCICCISPQDETPQHALLKETLLIICGTKLEPLWALNITICLLEVYLKNGGIEKPKTRFGEQKKFDLYKMEMQITWNMKAAITVAYPNINVEGNWCNCCDMIEKLSPVVKCIPVCWRKPEMGWFKLNTDGSFVDITNSAGIGGILRNEEGDLIMAFSISVDCESHNIAEALAAEHGIRWCMNHGFDNVQIELDSQIIVKMLLNKDTDNLKLKQIINNTNGFLKDATVQISHCYREANMVADFLAKMASTSRRRTLYLSQRDLPREVKGLIQLDKQQLPTFRRRFEKCNFFKKKEVRPQGVGEESKKSNRVQVLLPHGGALRVPDSKHFLDSALKSFGYQTETVIYVSLVNSAHSSKSRCS
ncbi:uncharacterized protein LOC132045445 [Lycium ferocissimum]|uniref:uncharacterized protein LOC132045445 n=1 Tax=Lycium ferocissimum TaxID=112874 RepID=UPI0028149B73|nr:uncharacterized protein LOC132045445 [Lycium ferocissimum]